MFKGRTKGRRVVTRVCLLLCYRPRRLIAHCWEIGKGAILLENLVRMRFLSAGALRAASMAKRGAAGVISPPPTAARPYHAGASTPIGEQIMSTMLDHWALSLGMFCTVVANFTYLMDFGGRWAREEEQRKLNREEYKRAIKKLKQTREKLEAQLERKNAGKSDRKQI